MELLTGVLLGMFVTYILKDKPFKIEIKHVYPQPELVEIPDMATVMSKGNNQEDNAYNDMGALLDEINNMMTGGTTNGKE